MARLRREAVETLREVNLTERGSPGTRERDRSGGGRGSDGGVRLD